MKRKLFTFLAIAYTALVCAQDYSDSWTGYFSYRSISALTQSEGKVYAAAQNSVFTYELETNQLETISTIQGLTGEQISAIHYAEEQGILFVGYASGLIDLILPDGNVRTLVAIRDKPVILPQEKIINSFHEFENTLYIASGFGISLFDLNRLEFDDSYFIGPNGSRIPIEQTLVFENYIYAASPTAGLLRAVATNSNLIDYRNWETLDATGWLGLAAQEVQLVGVKTDRSLQEYNGTSFSTVETLPAVPVDFQSSNSGYVITLADGVLVYDQSLSRIQTYPLLAEFPGLYTAGIALDGQVYAGTSQSGMLLWSNTTSSPLQIVPDGPLRNDPFSIEASRDELWVVYGDYSGNYNPYPLKQRGISHLTAENGWYSLPYDQLLGANNITNITLNSEDPTQVFLSSFNQGLLEVVEEVPIQIYDEVNSGLSDIPVNPTDVRINGAAFDRNGTLWMNNSQVENALARKTGDQIQGISIADLIPDWQMVEGYTDLVIGRLQNVYFGSSNRGLIAYDPDANRFVRFDAERSNLPSNNVQAVEVDANGTLWIGTAQGLRVVFSPAQIFENPELQARPIIIEENGIAVELLNDQVIRSIAVDGNNNKWVGTISSGVFYFSANGQETLLQFDTTNSPLPSNDIQDISIDPASGEVYFATPLGLVSYSGFAVEASENLENARVFPNPVRPQFTGQVTIDGLTERANVKITDLNGNLVYEEVSEGGSIQWDTTVFGGAKVASGVYFILITGEDAIETKVVKLMIIR